MSDVYVIGVSGESGVGKSTISKIISLFFGIDKTLTISTDDLHKWDRKSDMWENITHYNPDANNLELGDIHLKYLSEGKSVYRSEYNHDTGYFTPPKKIESKPIVIVEGLHAFYTEFSKNTINLKIYVDTDEELKNHWKIIRDTEERGYKFSAVLEAINKRKFDSDTIRKHQIDSADVIITLKPKNKIKQLGDKNEDIDVETSFVYNTITETDLFNFIGLYNNELNSFIRCSENIGNDISLCQDGGGNISVKINDNLMLIKASGYRMKDVFTLKGYSLVDYQNIKNSLQTITDDFSLNKTIKKSTITDKVPSMETGFHTILKKYVIHTHPIYLTTLLCLRDSELIINKLFGEYDYEYVRYYNPGFELSNTIEKLYSTKDILFLENHGLIVTSDNIDVCISLTKEINNVCKKYVNSGDFKVPFKNNFYTEEFPFPDSVMFLDDDRKIETISAHNFVIECGSKLGHLRYISHDNILKLRNLDSEKHRKNL